MAFQHQLTVTLAGGSSNMNGIVNATADSKPPYSIELTSSQSNLLVAAPIDISELKSIYILPASEVTIKTNSSSEPDDTFVIPGGVPFFWHEAFADWYPNPFSVDVEALYITNGVAAANTVQIDILIDSTPS